MRSVLMPLFACLLAALLVLVGEARAEKRVALVIGNTAYSHAPDLVNPKNDANKIAAALKRLRFDVDLRHDLDLAGFNAALADFSERAIGADFAVVYYAGHGTAIDRVNYLVPVDAALKRVVRIGFETIRLDRVLEAMAGATGIRIAIMDACRNDVFNKKVADLAGQAPGARKRSVSRGFSRPDPSSGTLVSFAARDGTVADDGSNGHSPYAAALLGLIEQPGMELSFLFRSVRDKVRKATNGQQEPQTYGDLPARRLYFKPPEAKPVPPVGSGETAAGVWPHVKDSMDVAVLEAFASRFKGTFHADVLAAKQIKALKAGAKVAAVEPDRPGEPVDRALFARGAKVYNEACAACHAATMSTGTLRVMLGTQAANNMLKALERSLVDIENSDDAFLAPFGSQQEAKDANDGYLPRDLIEIARTSGTGYIERVLTGYSGDNALSDGTWKNRHVQSGRTGMAPPLGEGMVWFADDDNPSVQKMAAAVGAFLEEAAKKRAVALALQPAAAGESFVDRGRRVYRKCRVCHVEDDTINKVGPHLNGLIDRKAGSIVGFRYSDAMLKEAKRGLAWSEAELARYLTDPKDFLPGTTMAFAGIRKLKDVESLIAYLKSVPKR